MTHPAKPEDLIRSLVRRILEEPSQAPNPGHYLPKEDKMLEWTLFQILEELKQLNRHLGSIALNSNLKR